MLYNPRIILLGGRSTFTIRQAYKNFHKSKILITNSHICFKTRYDIVEHEKKKTVTDHTMIMADYGSLQEELMKCREEMNEVSFYCFVFF